MALSNPLVDGKDSNVTDNGDCTSVVSGASSFEQQAVEQQTLAEEGTTALQTLIHLIKGYVGPGCLSLPWAFSKLGIFGGCVACIALSYWTSYNCWTVVQIKRAFPDEIKTYPDAGTWAYGKKFGSFVRMSICVQQLAICTVFMSFVGGNLLAVWTGGPNHAVVTTLALPAVLGLSCLASLKRMAPFTAAGTGLLFTAFGLLGAVMVKDWSDRPRPPPKLESLSSLPLALCAILYSFEGICLILPVEGAMANRRQFRAVFWFSMGLVALIFCAVASFSVFIFGDVTNGSITAYLLEREDDEGDRSLLILANTAVSISVLLTYPLQLFPCLELVGPWCKCSSREQLAQDDAEEGLEQDGVIMDDRLTHEIPGDSPMMRLGLVLFTYTIAIVVPNVQALISLAGALAGSSTALLIPPLIELEFVKRNSHHWLPTIRCCIFFGLGFIFMCIGTSASILDIIRIYSGM